MYWWDGTLRVYFFFLSFFFSLFLFNGLVLWGWLAISHITSDWDENIGSHAIMQQS